MGDVIAVDVDGNSVCAGDLIASRYGDLVALVVDAETLETRAGYHRLGERFAYEARSLIRNGWRRVPTPPAVEAETVRGWKRDSKRWPEPDVNPCVVTYYVRSPGGLAAWHDETDSTLAARGRPLTLAEVVDLIEPAQPAVEAEILGHDKNGEPVRVGDYVGFASGCVYLLTAADRAKWVLFGGIPEEVGREVTPNFKADMECGASRARARELGFPASAQDVPPPAGSWETLFSGDYATNSNRIVLDEIAMCHWVQPGDRWSVGDQAFEVLRVDRVQGVLEIDRIVSVPRHATLTRVSPAIPKQIAGSGVAVRSLFAPHEPQPAERGAVSCDDCKAALTPPQQWQYDGWFGCVYCYGRRMHATCGRESGPGIPAAVEPEAYEDGDVYELPGSEWP